MGYILSGPYYVLVNCLRCAVSGKHCKMVTKNESHWYPLKMDSVGPKLHQFSLEKFCRHYNTYLIVLQCFVRCCEVLCSCSGQDSYKRDRDTSKFKCRSACSENPSGRVWSLRTRFYSRRLSMPARGTQSTLNSVKIEAAIRVVIYTHHTAQQSLCSFNISRRYPPVVSK